MAGETDETADSRRLWTFVRRAFLPLSLSAATLVAGTPSIVFVTDSNGTTVEVRGLEPELAAELMRLSPEDDAWTERLAVYTEEAILAHVPLPPLLGSYSASPSTVRFTPRFALAPGVTYVACWRPGGGARGGEIRARYSVPRPELPPSTALLAIYPSGPEVPENLLRIYLQFSAPMSRGHAHRHIRLLDGSGSQVEGPFVAPERELWSPDGSRLTLFFDPGRIKRGVGPNSEVGPPLRAGGRYRLLVDRELADGRGAPLVRDYSKELQVREPDRDQPRAEEWVLEPPATSADPVRLRFPEPLDRGLLEGLLAVLDAGGEAVAGSVTVSAGETRWSFHPELGWGDGIYRIRVGTLLEDLAGNSLRRPFEAVLGGGGSGSEEAVPWFDLPFSVH